MLSLKQSKGSDALSALMSSPLTPREDETEFCLTHRVQLLRMRLMHFINNLHNYMMTRVLCLPVSVGVSGDEYSPSSSIFHNFFHFIPGSFHLCQISIKCTVPGLNQYSSLFIFTVI